MNFLVGSTLFIFYAIMLQKINSFGLSRGIFVPKGWLTKLSMSSFLSKRGPDAILPRDMAWLFEDTVWPLPSLSTFSGLAEPTLRQPMMSLDTKESKENYMIDADLPGVKLDDIKISLQKHGLTIKAEKQEQVDDEGVSYKRSERVFGKISRTIALPDNANTENVTAEFADGVLHVIIPKMEIEEEEVDLKEIPIQPKALESGAQSGKKNFGK